MGKVLNRRFTRTLRSAAAGIVATVCALILQPGPASGESPIEGPGPAFGAKILDIALTLDAQAKQSLAASPETGVPGQLSFKDASGSDKTYDVTIRIKGQKGSKRPIHASGRSWICTSALP